MKAIALVSGGKDSCHNMYLCQQHGHEASTRRARRANPADGARR